MEKKRETTTFGALGTRGIGGRVWVFGLEVEGHTSLVIL